MEEPERGFQDRDISLAFSENNDGSMGSGNSAHLAETGCADSSWAIV